MNRYQCSHIATLLFAAVLLLGCSDDLTSSGNPVEPLSDDAVTFATYMPSKTITRTAQGDFNTKMNTYHVVAADYDFTVEMYQQPVSPSVVPTLLGSAVYVPTKTYTYDPEDESVVTDSAYAVDGTLVPKGATKLYWPGNAKKYGFKATANTGDLAMDQSDTLKLLAQDKLLGYGFEPLWNTSTDAPVDEEDTLIYRTSKEWYAANQSTLGMAPGGVDAAAFYKKIPLYMKHQRSMITIRLKAGEGVGREKLAYEQALENIHTYIYTYDGDESHRVTPYAQADTVNYTASDYGEAEEGVATTKYTAVVEPHDYLTKANGDTIAQIQLSGQRFTFYAGNDSKYGKDNTYMDRYNLPAGKHLVITATLGRGSRKILITAYVEDWMETTTTSIVDDYGQTGDPIQITTRKQLYDFLSDKTKNKAGNVAIIVPNTMNLEKADSLWTTPMPLNCMLNLAGATLYTDHLVFDSIGSSGSLVNGTIAVGNAEVNAAVANVNLGTIEHVNIVATDASNNTSTAKATRAGLVVSNSGTITGCTSELPVEGEGTSENNCFVGGIAAESVYSTANGSTMPVIDRCTVNASVNGDEYTYGGGIVGKAVGRVSNNTYEYGITIRQNATNFKNIIQRKAGENDSYSLRAYGNYWPTTANNEIYTVATYGQVSPTVESTATNPNGTAVSYRYTAVIDCEEDLEYLLTTSTYNVNTSRIRLSKSFKVTKWTYGTPESGDLEQTSSSNPGNIFFELDGNNMTITTDSMLFTNIENDMYDLTVQLSGDIIATHIASGNEAIAALGYSVMNGATLSNIKVKGGSHRIQAYTVGGIVVWAYGNATIENCQCKANIQMWSSGMSAEAKTYVGGIAACAAKATFTQCTFHNMNGTLYQNTADSYTKTENGEETLTGVYYGGILGGTVPKGETGTEYPSVLITDCTSWFSTSGNNHQKGAIVGYGLYADGSVNKNGIAEGCQGNWWQTASDGIGTYISGKTIEELLGKRNAVKPSQDTTY